MPTAEASVTDRRVAAEATLESLRSKQATALADGKPFDPQPLALAEQALAGLERAEALTARRDREAATDRDRERRTKLARDYSAADAQRYGAIASAETAARQFAASVREALTAGDRMRAIRRELGVKPWSGFTRSEVARLFSQLLSSELAGVDVHPGRFGRFALSRAPSAPGRSAGRWADRDEFVAPEISPAELTKEKPNGERKRSDEAA